MSRKKDADLNHVHFLIAELEAELRALEAADELAQALAQLNEREGNGEPLVAVCGKTLRASLSLHVAQSPVTAGLAKLQDLRQAIAGRGPDQSIPVADLNHSVIDFAQRRDAAKLAFTAGSNRSLRRFGHAIAVSLALAAVTTAGMSWQPAIGRLPIIDIAGGAASLSYPAKRLAAADSF